MGLFGMLQASKQNKLDIKAGVMREALSEVFTDCVYDPEGAIKRETVRDSGLIDEWDRDRDSYDTKMSFQFAGNDSFSGKYKGCEVACCDVNITKYWTVIGEDEDGKEREREECETSFKGLWMICRLEKPLRATIRIREKADMPLLFRKIVGARVHAKSDVETENPAFNEQFQILTDDAHSAFYVLTPHFMEHILAADHKADGRTLLCFSGNQVHIAIHTGKDFFEIKKGSEIRDPEALKRRIQGELQYLTGILDELFHNKNLFYRSGLENGEWGRHL